MMYNASILQGNEFEFIEEAHFQIEEGVITDVGEGYLPGGVDYRQYLAMPSFFNAHTHLGDSFAKEALLGLNVTQAVGKKGLKWKLYESSTRSERMIAMKDSLKFMLASGTTGFADFREFGMEGINELKDCLTASNMTSIILGRDVDENECDGFGLNLYQKNQIPKNRKKILALHAGEKEGELEKALELRPDILVHFTKAGKRAIKQAVKNKISVVVCPRSNSLLQAGFPKVREMLDSRIKVSLGSDNVMLNQPNMLREMEYLFKVSHLVGKPLTPAEVLRTATYNGFKTFNINSGLLKKGMSASLLFLDKNAPNLRHSKDIRASIVGRCEMENIRKVMIDGKFVLNKNGK